MVGNEEMLRKRRDSEEAMDVGATTTTTTKSLRL